MSSLGVSEIVVLYPKISMKRQVYLWTGILYFWDNWWPHSECFKNPPHGYGCWIVMFVGSYIAYEFIYQTPNNEILVCVIKPTWLTKTGAPAGSSCWWSDSFPKSHYASLFVDDLPTMSYLTNLTHITSKFPCFWLRPYKILVFPLIFTHLGQVGSHPMPCPPCHRGPLRLRRGRNRGAGAPGATAAAGEFAARRWCQLCYHRKTIGKP